MRVAWYQECHERNEERLVNDPDVRPDEIWLLVDSRDAGGIETHMVLLCRALQDSGFNPVIVLMSDYGSHPLFSRHSDLAVKQLARPGKLAAALRRGEPSLVHTHGYKAGILGRTMCRMLGIPVVSTFHSGDRGSGPVKFYSMLDERTARFAPAISVSAEIAGRLPTRSKIIRNFVPSVTPKPKAIGEKRTVGFVGRLSEEKGPDIFCRLADRIDRLDFHLYGEGPMRSALEGTKTRAAFHGFAEDMETAWASIGLLCLTSRAEGLPMVALEAMVRGIPVAAFGVGDLPALITPGCGWIAAPGKEDEMAAILKCFADLPAHQLRCMGDKARAAVKAEYTPDVQLPKILTVYETAGWCCGPVQSDAA